MAKKERIRESLTDLPTLEYLMRRVELGWRPSAIEWERDILPEGADRDTWAEEIPYGLRVSSDCAGLVENPSEREVITLALDMIVQDCPLSRVAAELHTRCFLPPPGNPWSPNVLFSLLPRMFRVGPNLFPSEQWTPRRKHL